MSTMAISKNNTVTMNKENTTTAVEFPVIIAEDAAKYAALSNI